MLPGSRQTLMFAQRLRQNNERIRPSKEVNDLWTEAMLW